MNWQHRKFNRRRFTSGLTTVAMGAATLAVVGCGDDDGDGDEPESSTTPVATAQPKIGGAFNNRVIADLATVDPHQATAISTMWGTAPAFNQLVQYDPAKAADTIADITPDLATVWEQIDPQTLKFTLKPNVKFHDGSALTSADVKTNLEWFLNPPTGKPAPRRSLVTVIDKVETPDPLTVTLRLKQPSSALLAGLATHSFAIGQGKDIIANGEISGSIIGTGPFKFKTYEKANFIEFEKFLEYHVAGTPYLDRVRSYIVPDYTTALAGFKAKQYHMYNGNRPEDINDIESSMGNDAKAFRINGLGRTALFTNTEKPPLNNPLVRQAISMLIDYRSANDLFNGDANLPVGLFMKPDGAWGLPEGELLKLPGFQANVDAAKGLLSQAGVPSLKIGLSSPNANKDNAEYIQDRLRRGGIEVTINPLDTAALTALLNRGEHELAFFPPALLIDDPDAAIGEFGVTKAPRNWSRFSDPTVDALYAKQSQQLNAQERKATVNELERYAAPLHPMVSITFTVSQFAHLSSVQNYVFHTSQYTNYRMEKVWLEA